MTALVDNIGGHSEDAFRDVFVISSFRESHLDDVRRAIKDAVGGYESRYWVKMESGGSRQVERRLKPYRVIECTSQRPEPLLRDILERISNAAIVIVILDGLRLNVVFELGFLYGIGKPFVLLKHERYGPPFPEIDMLFSDFKGINVTSYNFPDPKNEQQFQSLIHRELQRCEAQFTQQLNAHSAIKFNAPNLASNRWTGLSQSGNGHRHSNGELRLCSSASTDLHITQHVSAHTCFMMKFQLKSENSAFSAYIELFFDDGSEKGIWLGYSSNTNVGRRCYPDEPEITVPLAVSGPGDYMFFDNISRMVSLRMGRRFDDGVLAKRIRLRGNDGEETIVTEVRLGDGRLQVGDSLFPEVVGAEVGKVS